MNFLAHLYLSGEDEKLMVGNFIGDFVKGRKYENYKDSVKQGILLHRQIDYFTDSHLKFREAKKLMVPEFGLYSGIVIDLIYDHLLAKNWNNYSTRNLREYSKWVHAVLLSNFFYLPGRVQGFLPVLIQNRRLESYATVEGIQKSLEIMSRYTSLPPKSKKAIEIMEANMQFFEVNFADFMDDVVNFVENDFGVKVTG
ncbi:MAG: ACP phosphodiesterase [Draconibacterium sp.]|nr:ACP phosphodiesterase [Draconibacterium sp.]